MNKPRVKNQYQVSPSGQLAIVLSNTRYTYTHFTEFHVTVLDLLEHNDLSHLTFKQKKNTLTFINMVLGLLDAPRKPAPRKTGKSGLQKLPAGEASINRYKATRSGLNTDAVGNPANLDKLAKLVAWIDQVVQLKRITVEKLLDDFYNLGIVELK